MQAGILATSDVMTYTSRVTVNGTTREHLSWNVQRELSGDLPAQVTAASGVVQATGSVVWAQASDVNQTSPNPWNSSKGWLPVSGDRVIIYAGDGSSEWRVFTGRIDETTGQVGSRPESTLVDAIDDLSVIMDHVPLLRRMPPLEDGSEYRGIGLSSMVYVNAAMREAGFYTTPAQEVNASLQAPLHGSVFPRTGTVSEAGSYDNVQSTGIGFPAPWGRCFSNFTATYIPGLVRSSSDPVQITMMQAPTHQGTAYVLASYGAASVQLSIDSTHVATARIDGNIVATLNVDLDPVVCLLVKNGMVTIRTSEGQEISVPGSIGGSGVLSSIRISGSPLARVAGIQVSHPTTITQEFATTRYVPTGNIDVGSLTGSADALPSIVGLTAREVLDSIAKATLSAMWIDELGILQYRGSDVLRSQGSVQTLTTLDDVLSLSWRSSLLGSRSKVIVNYRAPAISRSRYTNITCWEGSSETLDSGQESQAIIEPGPDEEWYNLDASVSIPGPNSVGPLNQGRGSWAGGVYTDGTDEIWATSPSLNLLEISVKTLSVAKWMVTHKVGTFPPENQIELRTYSDSFIGDTNLWPRWYDKNLPIFRGRGKATWTDLSRPAITVGGVGPALEHDAGPWNSPQSDTNILDGIGAYLATQLANPTPEITGMGVVFDPRRQLGDVINVRSDTLLGVELRCLIIGVTTSADTGFSQNLTVRVINVSIRGISYARFSEAWAAMETKAYRAFSSAWAPEGTYADFTADPLKGTN